MIFDTGLTQSNLDCFRHCTTPAVKSHFLRNSEIRKLNRLWHPWERENIEWSAYGAGVPIVLNDNETIVQYYVPYLSAVQIFTSNSPVNSLREETESSDDESDSFSGWSSEESESDKL
ncbi:hypothetical protein V6N13_065728 [Hibiscus sabdariffa]|uniref:Uncharacterized protein n=1 Tax=Hibiscus sabdariffa TaxID=183260 RepID=A0ABR2QQ31_9ROSI